MAAGPLGQRCTFYYLDSRGCGQSTRPITDLRGLSFSDASAALLAGLGLREQVADLERVRRILESRAGRGASGAVGPSNLQIAVIGHSFGGFIATLHALEFPDAVSSLVLESPAVMLRFPPDPAECTFGVIRGLLTSDDRRAVFDQFVKEYTDYSGLFSRTEPELRATNAQFLEFYAEAMQAAGRPLPPAVAATGIELSEIGGWVGPGIFMSMGLFGWDVRPLLAEVKADVLVTEGDQDLVRCQSYLTAFNGRAQHIVFEGVGHFAHDEAPVEWAAAVAAILTQSPV
jgi:pimeloyl-ACP methyl ester carboxylesterase